jgi:D-sedoheptulose 7-phosphate isomerase
VRRDLTSLITSRVEHSVELQRKLLEPERRALIGRVAERMCDALRAGGKIIFFGNGGSAADAQHIAGEFLGRFLQERRALPAVALSANTVTLTAIPNDYSFEDVFARQVEGLGAPGDVALGISTSGTSPNVVAALRVARDRGLHTLALTGGSGGDLREVVDVCVRVPSTETPRIQEGQLLAAHILCEVVELQVVASDSR